MAVLSGDVSGKRCPLLGPSNGCEPEKRFSECEMTG